MLHQCILVHCISYVIYVIWVGVRYERRNTFARRKFAQESLLYETLLQALKTSNKSYLLIKFI